MAWPSRDHRDYIESKRKAEPPAVPVEPSVESERAVPPVQQRSVTENFTVRASRFTIDGVQEGVERVAGRLGLRLWTSVDDSGRLRRDLKVTVAGEPDAIRELIEYIESLRAGSGGDAMPGPMG